MAIYALSLYGEDLYGVDAVTSFSVAPVTAVQTGYQEITLHWQTPTSSNGSWDRLRLVRNTAGYPSAEDDGDIVLDVTTDQPQTSYTDSGLAPSRFYYYTFFLASDLPAYSATTTYQPGDIVTYGGFNWMCVTASTQGVTPSGAASQWTLSNVAAQWSRAGQAMSLAVQDYGYRALLYDMIPTPYITEQTEILTPVDVPNSQLQRFTSVLAWALDMARTELGEQQHLHRVSTMPLKRMELLASELGVPGEASLTPRLRRYRVQNATQLARRRGTLESIKEAIYAATGYDAEFSESPNRMLDADQAEFRYPVYPAWDKSITYALGQIVSSNGYLYSATPKVQVVEAENATITLHGAPAYTIQQWNNVYSNSRQVLVRSNAVGQSVDFTFTVTTAGTYDVSVGFTRSFDYGQVRVSVDGVLVHAHQSGGLSGWEDGNLLTVDLYAPSPTGPSAVYLDAYSLASGSHTINVSVVGKNVKSGTSKNSVNGGYQMGVDYISLAPRAGTAITGIAPTGGPTSNAYWTYLTGVQSHVLDNPLTGGISTWEQVSFTAGTSPSNSNLTLYSGYQALNGVGDHTGNLAVSNNGTSTIGANLGIHSIPHAKITAWDSSTIYTTGMYVSYNGVNYLAILPSQGAEPDVDLTHWRPEAISTTGVDRLLASSYGIPLAHTAVWSGGATYAQGDVVTYAGSTYVASAPSHGVPPTGRPTDNASWAWMDSVQPVYTASMWTSLYAGTSTATLGMYIEWYDASGNLITTVPTSTGTDILATFAADSSNLTADLGARQELFGVPWTTTSTDIPVAFSGLAYWGTRTDPAATGRHLTTDYGVSNCNVGLTFVTAPPTGLEHGLLFRWSTSSNFWAASRTRLTKTVSGVTTTMASWTALADGSRIYVNLQGSTITVYSYQGPGLAPLQLATVTDSAFNTATKYGLFERTAP